MESSSEIVDDTFGKLSIVDESAYFAEVPWNRGLSIRLFIHVEGENHRKCIESAKSTFSSVRKNEMELFSRGMEFLTSIGAIDDPKDCEEIFLHNTAETSIELNSNGEGQLIYLAMMVGSLIIAFSHDATFQNAVVMAG